MVAVFDVLLCIVPGTTSIAEVVRHELANQDDSSKESTKCLPTNSETNDDWCQHCE